MSDGDSQGNGPVGPVFDEEFERAPAWPPELLEYYDRLREELYRVLFQAVGLADG